MEISYCTAPGNLRLDIGFGVAGYQMIKSMQRLGHKVPYDDRRSPIQLNFCQPEWYRFHENQYRIGYTPWESSALPESWPSVMNKCDEIWTTSPICKEWFLDGGVTRPIYVYEHGISPVWKIQERTRTAEIRFLHIGEPAPRKGGQIALDAFLAAFGDRKDVSLTMKVFRDHNLTNFEHDNVKIITKVMPEEELIQLHYDHDALIYPSYGEGFGLIPLQAAATGMPTVATKWWCSYSEYIIPLRYRLGDTPWPGYLHGKVSFPDIDHLVFLYRDIADNLELYTLDAKVNAARLHVDYKWDNLTSKVLEHLVEKFA